MIQPVTGTSKRRALLGAGGGAGRPGSLWEEDSAPLG
jgi:hypothetical protein